MSAPRNQIVDIHTHIYPPSYISLLRSRTMPPHIISTAKGEDRLIILPSEANSSNTSSGRPIGPEYYNIDQKIVFMDKHNISFSVLSLANPWLDWVHASEAAETAVLINDEVEHLCARYPERIYAFATLPLSAPLDAILHELRRIPTLSHVRGVIIGTTGLGRGLDDPALLPIFQALQDARLPIFLHPHYGLPSSMWGERAEEYGHVLPLALGFPMETTVAVTRMILGGVFDKVPELQVIVAHAGGTIPFLAGRIQSCIGHDGYLFEKYKEERKERRSVEEIMRENILLDAVVYGATGVRAAVDVVGLDRVMFGTDHPFFPPLEKEEGDEKGTWQSVVSNVNGIEDALGIDTQTAQQILGINAVKILRLA